MIYVNIGDVTDKTLTDVRNAIAQEDHDIMLLIDSLGGSLQAGLEIFDSITTCPKERHTFYARCCGNVASSATLILCGVPMENRSATQNTCFLIHNPLVSLFGPTNMGEIKQLADSMETANEQIKNIYRQRTHLDDATMDALMVTETEFYASKAVEYGLIGHIEQLQNRRATYSKDSKDTKNQKIKKYINNSMKKSFIQMLTNKLVKALLNESYQSVDGEELEISALEVGGTCNKDGVFEIDGQVITVEGGVIVDIIDAPVEEEPALENEGEEEVPAEPEAIAEEVAEQVEEQVAEEDVTDATEVAEIVKEVVAEELAELTELQELVEKCGGKDKLKALANVKHNAKVFASVPAKKENKSRSIAELMALKHK